MQFLPFPRPASMCKRSILWLPLYAKPTTTDMAITKGTIKFRKKRDRLRVRKRGKWGLLADNVPKRLVNSLCIFLLPEVFFLPASLLVHLERISLSISPKQKSWLFIFTTWKTFSLSFSSVFMHTKLPLWKKQGKSPRTTKKKKGHKESKK